MASHIHQLSENPQLMAAAKMQQNVKRSVLGSIGNTAQNISAAKKAKTQPLASRAGPVTRASTRTSIERPCDAMETQEDTIHLNLSTLNVPARPANVENIDADDLDNPQMVAEYVNEIYVYMRELEGRYKLSPDYLQLQPEINEKMRSILVDWLVEVHYRFELLQETLYLTVFLLDRYLSLEKTSRGKLQLVGVTAMLIACKYEEMYPPEVGDFVYISDNAYKREEIINMEQKMLRALDFNLGRPLPLHFLRRNSRAGHADGLMHTMAKYFMELTLGSAKMLRYLPSEIAGAATYISREVVHEDQLWTATLEYYSDYTVTDIQPCIDDMKELLAASLTSRYQAVRTKYARSNLLRISRDPSLEAFINNL